MPAALSRHPDVPALAGAAFATLMARFAPFEPAPHLAVGVSGGADSLALALLAQDWAQAQGGRVTALTVDHGLRPESGAEAAQVGRWLARHGIAHVILPWTGPKPAGGLQARAREARRTLLTQWCRDASVLHLLLAHQREDQAETVLLRREHDSGPDGLAAMAACVELPDLRLLRPLLDVAHATLIATLQARGQDWVEDPSNQNPHFTRVRLRRGLDGAQAIALAASSRQDGASRTARERDIAVALARTVAIYPQGWATLDPVAWGVLPPELGEAVLGRVLRTIGGSAYGPRGARRARLDDRLRLEGLGRGRTLGGCRLLPWRDRIVIAREAHAAPEIALDGPVETLWDNRFWVSIAVPRTAGPGWRLGPLGEAGWASLAKEHKPVRCLPIPHAARLALPAVKDLDGVLEVPHLLYRRRGSDPVSVAAVKCAQFQPLQPLAGPEFATF
jgi:tRNA(Ile)-lysidine synthase